MQHPDVTPLSISRVFPRILRVALIVALFIAGGYGLIYVKRFALASVLSHGSSFSVTGYISHITDTTITISQGITSDKTTEDVTFTTTGARIEDKSYHSLQISDLMLGEKIIAQGSRDVSSNITIKRLIAFPADVTSISVSSTFSSGAASASGTSSSSEAVSSTQTSTTTATSTETISSEENMTLLNDATTTSDTTSTSTDSNVEATSTSGTSTTPSEIDQIATTTSDAIQTPVDTSSQTTASSTQQ